MMAHRSFADENLPAERASPGVAPAEDATPLRLGMAQFDPADRSLKGPDGAARLEPRVAKALEALHAHQGEVVTRDVLFDAIWPRGVVGDDSLNRLVSALRRHLRDVGAGDAVVIETVPRTGYRLRNRPGEAEGVKVSRLDRRTAIAGGAILALGSGAAWFLAGRKASQPSREVAAAIEEAEANWEVMRPVSREGGWPVMQELHRANPGDSRVAGALAIASAEELGDLSRDPAERAAIRASLGEVLRVAPDEAARTARALAAWTSDDWSVLEAALDAAPRNKRTLGSRIEFLGAVGRLDEASEIAATLLAERPRSQRRLSYMAAVEMRRGNYQEAEKHLASGIYYFPNAPVLWVQAFINLAAMGRFREALGRFENRAPGTAESAMPPSAIEAWALTLKALAGGDPDMRRRAITTALAAPKRHFSAAPASLLQLALLGAEEPLITLARAYYTLDYAIVRKPGSDPGSKLQMRAMWGLWDSRLIAVRRSAAFGEIARETGLKAYWRGGGALPDDSRAARLALTA